METVEGESSGESLKRKARRISLVLKVNYPGDAVSLCALEFDTPFQLLVATVLSAQCTDERVNSVTPVLFEKYPDAKSMAQAEVSSVEKIVYPTGFFRAKAGNLVGLATALESDHGGIVPRSMEDLVKLPGVGRKTANVVRSVGFGLPGLPVDTHVKRLTNRIGLTSSSDPVKIEKEISGLVPPSELGALSLRLILHGRAVCTARAPNCTHCVIKADCVFGMTNYGKKI